MTPARWQQIKKTVAAALAEPKTAERAAYVARVCANDTALRREVESLIAQPADALEAFAAAGGFLHPDSTPIPYAGRRIGAYQLVRELGRGGMGSVWLGERVDKRFDQQVAIKLLTHANTTADLLERFQAERRILARLDHRGIARLFDGGETEEGVPFFIMEYVAGGESITTFAQQRNLSISARIELVRAVCAVIQFAHQNLIVHRDLKPGNILVTPSGEPKILDFGIARSVGIDRLQRAAIRDTSAERLTYAYASPEQREGGAISTATDIYSLGILLHELLAGELPQEEHPAAKLRGDLCRIVAKAMSRDPNHRYGTASALASDLRRYLEGRPVAARPATVSYRASKFIGRHKIGVTAAVFYALALLVAALLAMQQAYRAQHRFAEVQRLSHTVLFEIHDAIRDLPGATAARQLIINRALEHLDLLARDSGGETGLQLELANAYVRVGDVQGKPYTANLGDSAGALHSYRRAIELASAVANHEAHSSTAARAILSQAYESEGTVLSRLNHSDEAIQSHRRAIAIRDELLRDDPSHAEQWERGIIADQLGLGDAVVSAHRLHPVPGFQRVALDNYKPALALCEKLVAAHPDSGADDILLARIYSRVGTEMSELAAEEHDLNAFNEAWQLLERAIRIPEAQLQHEPGKAAFERMLADGLLALAYSRSLAGEKLDLALEECSRSRHLVARLARNDPSNVEAQQDLSSSYFVLARVRQAQHDSAGAADAYRQCLAILNPLVRAHQDNVETAFDLERVRQGLAAVTTPTP